MTEHNDSTLDEIAVSNFINYLQFATVHPDPDYGPALVWLLSKGKELHLECTVVEYFPGNPILIMCWKGSRPELGAILLNSHMDVVPVVADKWSYPPFSAIIAEGKIYARGSQDMKCIGIQQLESVRRLKALGYSQLKRTIYLSFVPDEEIGGKRGMKPFVAGAHPIHNGDYEPIRFCDLNIELCLDEGLASPSDDYIAYYDERRPCWMKVNFHGNAGHGLALIPNTAAEKFRIFLNHQEQKRLEDSMGKLTLGDITTVNMTMLDGGLQCNVVPEIISATFDVRLTPSLSFEDWKIKLNHWVDDVCGQIDFEFMNTGVDLKHSIEHPDRSPNKWWKTLESQCMSLNIHLKKKIFPGGTDARFVREYCLLSQSSSTKPIQAIGFSPIRNTPILLHDHDEYLGKEEFLNGCRFYANLIKNLGQLDEC